MFYATRRQVYLGLRHKIFCWYSDLISLTHTHTHTHRERDTQTHTNTHTHTHTQTHAHKHTAHTQHTQGPVH